MNPTVPFRETLGIHGLILSRAPVEIVQVNVGKLCNQACRHCHVDAGPKRTEIMNRRTAERVLELTDRTPSVHTLDITGGAPELNPNFRTLVTHARRSGKEVIDRCNLTVLLERGQEDTARFLAAERVQIVASLPCYTRENVDRQRGQGVYDKSIRALKQLNELGYGKDDSGLILHLVYNPLGPSLPPPQEKLEVDYKKELKELFEIEFNHLRTVANMPIHRFRDDLLRHGKLDDYMNLLVNRFNPLAAMEVMCRNLISISWDGRIYDCDFNQMLEIPAGEVSRTIWELESFDDISRDRIAFDAHCYGCTAGAGSSCHGALAISRKGETHEH